MERIGTIAVILLILAIPASGQYSIPARTGALGLTTLNPGWQWVQGTGASVAGDGVHSSFTLTVNPPVLLNPLTGDLLLVFIYWSTPGVTVTSMSRAVGETWVSAGSGCEITGGSANNSVSYTLSSVALGTNPTVTFSGPPSNTDTIFFDFEEYEPPAGFTPSQDGACTHLVAGSNCTSCTATSITTTSTDLVIMSPSFGGVQANDWNSWSSPFQQAYDFQIGFGLDLPAGTYAPTFQQTPSSNFGTVAIAFKTTAGTYSGPPQTFSVKNLTMSAGTNVNCNPSCNVTIPSTTANNALVGWVANSSSGTTLSSVTCGGCSAFTIPSGCSVDLASQGHQNCFYLFNIPASVTTITLTNSANAATGYQIYELARSNGPWVFDASGSANRAASSTPSGLSPTITGTVDAVFQSIWQNGGAGFLQFYAAPTTAGNGFAPACTGGCYLGSLASGMTYLNTANTVTPTWNSNSTLVSAVAYFSIK